MTTNYAKMPSSTNASNSNTPVTNVGDNTSSATAKRELSSSIISNGAGKLSSLTPARDLTLGGRGGAGAANKRIFLPNLNVVRNKNTNVKTSKDTTLTRGRGRGRNTDRGGMARGGTRGGSSLIQTTGVFSEGAGAVTIRQASRPTGYSREVDDSPSTMKKPTLFKTEKKLDLKAELAKDINILKLLDDADEDVAEQKTDLDKIPVRLNEAKWKYVKTEIKQETSNPETCFTDLTEVDAVAVASQIQAMHVAQQTDQNKRLPRYPQSLSELFNSSSSQIFLMQVPDTLPCVDDDSDLPECSKSSLEDSVKLIEKKKNLVKSPILKKMDEGQVGRLMRFKSGKTKLVLGETYFDLDMGMETGFLQDLMSISCNRDERSGNMINLGPLQAKITATPDWEHLLKGPNEDQNL